MFLFDKHRTSQQSYTSGNKVYGVNWKTFLNTNPLFGAESTVVFDESLNLYFGSHSGNFYSLNKNGEIRWVFTTKTKIYSSPIIIKDSVIFAGGDGFLYSLSFTGELNWLYDLSERREKNKPQKLLALIAHLPFTYSFARKKNITYRSWSSPNLIDNKIYITGYGIGLFCFDIKGNLLWKHDLGFPRFQLSGVAIDDHNNIYGSSRKGYAYCMSDSGKVKWKRKIKMFWEPWGNPVVCPEKKHVYFFFSLYERSGLIYALTPKGDFLWKLKVGAVRGSCAVTRCGSFLYCCDLDGFVYKIDATNGTVLLKTKLTNIKRGLWTTPTLDANEDVLLSSKDGNNKGRIIKLNPSLEVIWEFPTGKVLSVPVINKDGDVFFGSWDGYYYSIKTKNK